MREEEFPSEERKDPPSKGTLGAAEVQEKKKGIRQEEGRENLSWGTIKKGDSGSWRGRRAKEGEDITTRLEVDMNGESLDQTVGELDDTSGECSLFSLGDPSISAGITND